MGKLQRNLIPGLEACGERPLTDKEQQLVSILEVLQIEKFVVRPARRFGRKPWERQALARAFVAKAVYNHPHTRATIEALRAAPVFRRICGFVQRADIPSEATFSRAFAEFARLGLGEKVHAALVAEWVKPELVGHISRDATAIEGREKPLTKPQPAKPAPRKRGRPGRGEVREPKPETRLERQGRQSAQEALGELPAHCDAGTKKNSKGYKETWIGYKLHADVNDCGLPISVALTAASLHDSQVAIPLMKLTSERVDYLYDLMDAAYDANPIYEVSRSLGHVPIIDKNGRGREVIPLAPHEAARYRERTASERFNGRLKEEFGGDNVMVRGAQKVALHLMFGVIALFADQLLKLIS
ncbi:MAG: transposase [Deltaproteobacteria bacterium]|nr:transposase [Deltaproteobacteria bacterium]